MTRPRCHVLLRTGRKCLRVKGHTGYHSAYNGVIEGRDRMHLHLHPRTVRWLRITAAANGTWPGYIVDGLVAAAIGPDEQR